ncbi:hypothetical protein GCM10025857_15790 [Alicyclobacillus contaminans]|uniref:DUF2140 family protein n=1 Tax=Alicyclobacillus contaminans TaxID=392016 RepID=UPI000404BB62|nr:DUF2140 family protein [Alicyclobacillus contaminans]GMA50222.1 hypothetical protein GCM10025857_15790 [Alicyclobacillus contaminans]
MWKKAFVALLSFNLLIVVGLTLWWGSLPKTAIVQRQVNRVASQNHTATVQLAVGEDAVNSYLEYAVSEQKDVQRVLSYARVHFADNWDVQVGIKLADRVIPCDIQMEPTANNGNLALHVTQANMGEIPVPVSALFFVFNRLPWPNWISVDSNQHILNLLFSNRPQEPYGVQVMNYSSTTKLVTLRVSIVPKSLLSN